MRRRRSHHAGHPGRLVVNVRPGRRILVQLRLEHQFHVQHQFRLEHELQVEQQLRFEYQLLIQHRLFVFIQLARILFEQQKLKQQLQRQQFERQRRLIVRASTASAETVASSPPPRPAQGLCKIPFPSKGR